MTSGTKWSMVLSLSFLALTGCEKALDHEKIAQSIQDSVIKQGGTSLRSVTCPKGIKPEADKTFECIGETDLNYTFTIPVKQTDNQGTVSWDVPNSKGLLNVAKFETTVQDAVTSEVGSRSIVRCGDGFKPIKPGQTFLCRVLVKEQPKEPKATSPSTNTQSTKDTKSAKEPKAKPAKPLKPDKIVVSVDADGNVNWQLVMRGAISQLLPKPIAPAQASGVPIQPAPPQQNADDFLNQPGASAGFED